MNNNLFLHNYPKNFVKKSVVLGLPQFKNKKLFDQAFTHRSFLNETKQKIESNERFEFLGDSILSFVVSRNLFVTYPQFNEGTLTNLRSLLVNTKSLASVARQLQFGTYLKLSKGEEEANGRENQSILANSFEAFVGALFLDQGISCVSKFISQTLLPRAREIVEKNILKDPKSMLQEYVQSKKQESPQYKVLKEEGPAHQKKFTIGVYVNNQLIGEGLGKSKQEAEEHAAQKALEKIEAK